MKQFAQKLITLLAPFLGRYLLIVGLVVTAGIAGYGLYKERNARLAAEHELVGKTEEARALGNKLSTMEKTFVTEAEALKQLKAENAALADAVKKTKLRPHVSTTVKVPVSKPSVTQEGPSPFPKTFSLFLGEETKSPLAGTVLVRPDGSAEKRVWELTVGVSLHVLDREDGGSEVVGSAYLEQDGKRYPVQMETAKVTVVPRTPRGAEPAPGFRWTLGVSMTGLWLPLKEAAIGADLYLAGYGPTDRDLTWRFFHLGAAYTTERKPAFYFAPFSWRPLPRILKNTYLTPAWTWSTVGTGSPALGLSVQL